MKYPDKIFKINALNKMTIYTAKQFRMFTPMPRDLASNQDHYLEKVACRQLAVLYRERN